MSLSDRAMLVKLTVSMWTAGKIDKIVTRETNAQHRADESAGSYRKKLAPKEALSGVTTAKSRLTSYHKKMTATWGDDGTGILPAETYMEYIGEMKGLIEAFDLAADDFAVSKYPIMLRGEEGRLGTMHNSEDYPPVTDIRKRFGLDVKITSVPDTKDFRVSIGEDELAEIRADIEKRSGEAQNRMLKDLFGRLLKVVKHAAEKLSNDEPNFQKSMIENISKLTAIMPTFNLTGDPDLARITKEVGDKLCDYTAAELRDDDDLRSEKALIAKELVETIEKYVA